MHGNSQYQMLRDGIYKLLHERHTTNKELIDELDKIGGDDNDVQSIFSNTTATESKSD